MKPENTHIKYFDPDYPYELIQGCRRGDQKAQLQVYKLYYKKVFSKCMQIVNDPVAAEDLMHESFLIAFENMNSYKGDIIFPAWINLFIKDASRCLNLC
jgi:DNA-directed RNA polymerase specialized sigma24 family protein